MTDIQATFPERPKRVKSERKCKIDTPAELIVTLHQAYPKDDKITAGTRFVQKVVDEGLFHRELAELFHSLNYNRLTQKAKPRAKMDAEDLARRARVKAHMLKGLTINTFFYGKKLREWTGVGLAKQHDATSPVVNALKDHCGNRKIGSVFTTVTLKEFLSSKV